MGDSNAFNPNMWAGSGVPNPQNFGKPPGQGGFNVQSLLPPNLLPGAGQAGGQGSPHPPVPSGGPGGNNFGGSLGAGGAGTMPGRMPWGGQMPGGSPPGGGGLLQSPFAAAPMGGGRPPGGAGTMMGRR